jgi:hypothetical protein
MISKRLFVSAFIDLDEPVCTDEDWVEQLAWELADFAGRPDLLARLAAHIAVLEAAAAPFFTTTPPNPED